MQAMHVLLSFEAPEGENQTFFDHYLLYGFIFILSYVNHIQLIKN
jgi:hypothetical protein